MKCKGEKYKQRSQQLQRQPMRCKGVSGVATWQARRAALLRSVIMTIEGGATARSDPAAWRVVLRTLREISEMQRDQGAVATRRGSLEEYCADGYADALCKQSDAIAAAATLLEECEAGSYEATTYVSKAF